MEGHRLIIPDDVDVGDDEPVFPVDQGPRTGRDFNLIDASSKTIRRIRKPDFSYRDMLVNVHCPPGPGTFFRRSAAEATRRTYLTQAPGTAVQDPDP